jgi:hypothetical protein
VFWLAALFLVNGSTTELAEQLDDGALFDNELELMQLGKSSGTSALQMELEGMVDSEGNPLFAANASDAGPYTPPPIASESDIASMTSGTPGGDVEVGPIEGAAGEYYEIPFLLYEDESKEHGGLSLSKCEGLCDDDAECKSFTYIKGKNKCYISTGHLQYDMEFEFMVKYSPAQGGEPEFHDIGPIKYGADALEKAAAHNGYSVDRCQQTCATDLGCFSIAYRARDQLCIQSSQSIHFDQDATYFEKQGVAQEEATAGPAQQPVTPAHEDGPVDHDADTINPHSPAMRKEISEKASLTSEQKAFLARAKEDGSGIAQKQALQNAIYSTNVELRSKNQAKVQAAKERTKKAYDAAALKRSRERLFKHAEAASLKQSQESLHELMEGVSKSEEKKAEVAAKGEAKSKEAAEKEKERLKSASGCEKTRQSLDAADLKNSQLQSEQTERCAHDKSTSREAQMATSANSDAVAKVSEWENKLTDSTKTEVYVSQKYEIKAVQAKIEKLNKELAQVSSENSARQVQIDKLKDKLPDLDTELGAAQNAKVRASSALESADLAVSSAVAPAEMTTAKSAQAGARSALARAESQLEAAKAAAKAAQAKLTALQDAGYQGTAKEQKLEPELESEKVALKNAENEYFTNYNKAKMDVGVAKHQLPLAKANERSTKSTLDEKKKASVSASKQCARANAEVSWQAAVVKTLNDEETVCASERTAKAAAKLQAEKDFEAAEDEYNLELAKRRESDFTKLMADAETAVSSADTMEGKADAGAKLADYQASKMQSEQQVAALIPKVQTSEVVKAKADAKAQAAEQDVQEEEDTIAEDKKEEAKAEAEEEKVSPNNPDVIIGDAKSLLEKLREQVAMAEVNAGEKDTTSEDESDIHNRPPTKTKTAKPRTLHPADSAEAAADLEHAEDELAHGDEKGAMDAMKQAEDDVHADTDTNKLIVKQVKKQAHAEMLASKVKAANSALSNDEEKVNETKEKEAQTKDSMKQLQVQMKEAKEKAAIKALHAHQLAAQWPFAGNAEDTVGEHGAATLQDTAWIKDPTYGQCLSFEGIDSEANLGDLDFNVGTISLWVRINEGLQQQLFGPGMESEPAVKQVEVSSQAVAAEVSKQVDQSLSQLKLPVLEAIQLGEQKARGSVSFQTSGSVTIYDGEKDVALSAAGAIVPGAWTQLAFTFTGEHVTLYVNGALQHTVECANDYKGHPFIIGRGLSGSILNVDFWTRVLKRVEVAKLPKPATPENMHFEANSPTAQYEMAKAKEKDLTAQERVQKSDMHSAERKIKAENKEKEAQEVRDKNAMKAEKERRDQLAAQDKANEVAEKDEQKEQETKARKRASREEGQKNEEKSKEAHEKAGRREAMEKEEVKQRQEEQASADERTEKANQRDEDLRALRAKVAKEKSDENNSKETHSKEAKQKKQEFLKKKMDAEVAKKQEDAANQEREQKTKLALQQERMQKQMVAKQQALREQELANPAL